MIKKFLLALAILAFPTQTFAISADDKHSVLFDSIFYDEQVECIPGATALVGSSNIQKAYNYFLAKGLKDFQSAGIVGNLIRESSVVPDRVEGGGSSPTIPPRGGYGIAQWTSRDRKAHLEQFASQQGKPVSDLGLQLDFIWEELHTTQKGAFNALIGTTTVEQATTEFEDKYERAGVVALAQRIQFAREVLELYGGGAPPGDLGSSTCGPTTPPTGTAAQLAKQLLDSRSITGYGRLVRQDLEKTANGEVGTAGKPMDEKLLQLLVAMSQRFSFVITALQSGGTGHTATSNHYQGKAADIVPTGSTTYNQINIFIYENRVTFNIDELIFYPMPSGIPTLKNGEPFTYSDQVLYGSDGRNGDNGHEDHNHTSVK